MPTGYRRIAEFLRSFATASQDDILARLKPHHRPPGARVSGGSDVTPDAIDTRWALLDQSGRARAALCDDRALETAGEYGRNIEHFVGLVKLPVGVIGPLRVNGLFANGDFYVPLATTEAALVASYSRGARLITESGGCTALVLNEGVSRAPGFAFDTVVDAARFVTWATTRVDEFRAVASGTTKHGQLVDLDVTVEGNHVYLGFEFTTGDASGQNIVTLATEAICRHIMAHAPITPRYHFLEANLSGDKKATSRSFLGVRGKKVSAEVRISAEMIDTRLHTTSDRLVDYWRMSALGGVMSGSLGVQGQYANGLAALFIACGQDAAAVAEASVGVTRFERLEDGGLYASVTLPNVIVGTVGGGTSLPTQRACLEIMGLAGSGHARALAEVTTALALAGELSITGAMAAGHFADAHRRLARAKRESSDSTDSPSP